MNESSAAMYINNIICMLRGQKYPHNMAKEDVQYFLARIKNDFDMETLEKALDSVKQRNENWIKNCLKNS